MGFDILIILMNLIDNALENTSANTINVDIVYNHDIIIKVCNYSIKIPSNHTLNLPRVKIMD